MREKGGKGGEIRAIGIGCEARIGPPFKHPQAPSRGSRIRPRPNPAATRVNMRNPPNPPKSNPKPESTTGMVNFHDNHDTNQRTTRHATRNSKHGHGKIFKVHSMSDQPILCCFQKNSLIAPPVSNPFGFLKEGIYRVTSQKRSKLRK